MRSGSKGISITTMPANRNKAYDKFFKEQEGKCALCDRTDLELILDHDHECCRGKRLCGLCYRGLLCQGCNIHMGDFDAALKGALLVGWKTTYLITWYYPKEAEYVLKYATRRERRERYRPDLYDPSCTARSRTERDF